MKYTGKARNLVLLALFLLSLIFYVSFFVYKIKRLASPVEVKSNYNQEHILVGVEDSDSDFVKQFFLGVKTVSSAYEATAELLFPETGNKYSSLEEWCQYAQFVGADGLILLSSRDDFFTGELKTVHNQEIPLVLAGECSLKTKLVSHITVSNYQEGKILASEIKKSGSSRPLAILRKNYASDEIYRIISAVDKNLSEGEKISVQSLKSPDVIDDEVRSLLLEIARSKRADLILCYGAEDLNLVSQTIIDLNLADRLSVIGIYGDSKTDEYLEKGIVISVVNADPFSMGVACAEELFSWKIISFANSYRTIDVNLKEGGAL